MVLLTHILILSLRQYANQRIRLREAATLFLLVGGDCMLTFYPLMRSFQLGQDSNLAICVIRCRCVGMVEWPERAVRLLHRLH